MDNEAGRQAIRFSQISKQINGIYENYAKANGLTYTSLYVLHMVFLREDCRQTELCEHLFIPKQTINSIVMSFQKKGLMETIEMPEDRRHKTIHLTDKGNAYARQILPQIERAEVNSMAHFSEEERTMLLNLMGKYAQIFERELQKIMFLPLLRWEKKISI